MNRITEAVLNFADGPFFVSVGTRDVQPFHDCDACPCESCPGWCCNVVITHEVYGRDVLVLVAEEAEIAEEVCRDANQEWGAAVVGAFGDARLHGPWLRHRSWDWVMSNARREVQP